MEPWRPRCPPAAALDRARRSRDARFDGRFFVGVTSTGVYCRPVCPAPSPRDAHVRYFPTAAAAGDAGFRPCLRCRPEAAPGTPAWLGTSAVVRRALALVHEGALDEGSVDALAARLGIGPRHLHRLFVAHVGAPPLAVAKTRRLHFAKRLIDETDLSMTEIAFASGFGSLRRFNDTFLKTYDRAPSALRRLRRPGAAPARGEIALRLAFRPPYDLAHLLAFLATRAIPGGRAGGRDRLRAHGRAPVRARRGERGRGAGPGRAVPPRAGRARERAPPADQPGPPGVRPRRGPDPDRSRAAPRSAARPPRAPAPRPARARRVGRVRVRGARGARAAGQRGGRPHARHAARRAGRDEARATDGRPHASLPLARRGGRRRSLGARADVRPVPRPEGARRRGRRRTARPAGARGRGRRRPRRAAGHRRLDGAVRRPARVRRAGRVPGRRPRPAEGRRRRTAGP